MAKTEKLKFKIDKLLLCDNAFLSRENKLSIIGIFDDIYSDNIPTIHPTMYLVGMITGVANLKDKITLEITNEKEIRILKNMEIEIGTGFFGKGNFIIQITMLKLENYGTYNINILKENKKIASTSFRLLNLGRQGDKKANSETLPN